MEYQHEQILSKFEQQLKATLNLSYLLPSLVNRELITPEEEASLKLPSKSYLEKNSEFLSIIKAKGPRAFDKFLEALADEDQHLGHRDLYSKLSNADRNGLNILTHNNSSHAVSVKPADTPQVPLRDSEVIVPQDLQNDASRYSVSSKQCIEERINVEEQLYTVLKQFIADKFEGLERSLKSSISGMEKRIGDLEATLSRIDRGYSGRSGSLLSLVPEEEEGVCDIGCLSLESGDTFCGWFQRTKNYHHSMKASTKLLSLRAGHGIRQIRSTKVCTL